jgi:hypothetical protein
MNNFELFKTRYKDNLINARMNYPTMYAWPESELESVFKRMIEAIERGSFNKDSIALKNTCKDLRINHTYKAIREFINGGEK